jgi:hypothetical protein
MLNTFPKYPNHAFIYLQCFLILLLNHDTTDATSHTLLDDTNFVFKFEKFKNTGMERTLHSLLIILDNMC